ncbi:MAG: YidC/Oxa1 family membrane protein insertase [Lachnospiraceae bacterium]|nr:YidC/Oxa1 family membrane protein insertase [Lachnospiraceae bacterium]
MSSFGILTTYNGAILGPIAKLLGVILEGIYKILANIGIENTGVCIIIFTFLINALMIPLQVKQQKFSKMSSIMNPELQKIQNKYKNKKDQESQRKQNLEIQAVYQKYGVSPVAGCLPLLITFPIIFALYRVIYNVPAYVSSVGHIYENLAKPLKEAGIKVDYLWEVTGRKNPTYVVNNAIKAAKKATEAKKSVSVNYYIDVLSQYTSANFDMLKKALVKDGKDTAEIVSTIASTKSKAARINTFLGMNIADLPKIKSLSVLIPIVSVITQYISSKISMASTPQNNNKNSQNDVTNATMKSMTTVMPFVSGVMCFMFPIGVGIYWIAGNVFRIFQSLFINLYFDKKDLQKEISDNVDKSKRRFKMLGMEDDEIKKLTNKKIPTDKEIQDSKLGNKKTEESTKTEKKPVSYYANGGKNNKKNNRKNNNKNANNNSNNSEKAKTTDSESKEATKNYKKGSISSYANMLNRRDS